MLTQVRIIAEDQLIAPYPDWTPEQTMRINLSIAQKIQKPILGLPCRPKVGDTLNLLSFIEQFELTDAEKECLSDCNYLVIAREVVICMGYLEVYVQATV